MIIKERKIQINSQLFPWQSDIIKGVLSYPNDIHIAKSKRQIGKSVTVEMVLLYYAINKRNTVSVAISPTLNQSRKLYKEIRQIIIDSPVYKSSNGSTLEIEFSNNSTILFKSAEQRDALRGLTVSGILCFDEAVFMSDDIIMLCLPFVDAHRSPILMTSTPKFRSGCFYDFFQRGLSGVCGFHSYDVNEYNTSQLLTNERLEMYRQSVAPQIFKSEFLGQWIDATSQLFGDLDKLCSDVITPANQRVLGIDWSNGAMDKSNNPDETAVVMMNEYKQVEKYWAFADKDEVQTIDFIVDTIKTYNIKKCIVETNSMGGTYVSILRKAISSNHLKCQIIEFYTSQKSKQDIVQQLQVECQNRTIQLPKTDNQKLLLELISFEVSPTKTGLLHYEASSGNKDDIVMALCFALYGLKQGSYCVR